MYVPGLLYFYSLLSVSSSFLREDEMVQRGDPLHTSQPSPIKRMTELRALGGPIGLHVRRAAAARHHMWGWPRYGLPRPSRACTARDAERKEIGAGNDQGQNGKRAEPQARRKAELLITLESRFI